MFLKLQVVANPMHFTQTIPYHSSKNILTRGGKPICIGFSLYFQLQHLYKGWAWFKQKIDDPTKPN
jgi:hypothetical protein